MATMMESFGEPLKVSGHQLSSREGRNIIHEIITWGTIEGRKKHTIKNNFVGPFKVERRMSLENL